MSSSKSSSNNWYRCWSWLAIGALAAVPVAAESQAVPQITAQSSLVGQCRVTNKATDFYETRGGSNPKPADVIPAQTEVILSDNGSSGLIGVSRVGGSARSGFVPAGNLYVGCKSAANGGTTTGTAENTCRRITSRIGLVVHRNARRASDVVGSVAFNQRVDLSTNPATVRLEADGRRWVEIAKPVAGWVSNGYSGTNLVYCR